MDEAKIKEEIKEIKKDNDEILNDYKDLDKNYSKSLIIDTIFFLIIILLLLIFLFN